MSDWDELEPHEKRSRLLQDPAEAKRIIAADARFNAAMQSDPADIKAMREALEDDASPDRPVIAGIPPLHVAIHRGDLRAIETLLLFSASTDDVSPDGTNALDIAIRARNEAAQKLLKQYGAATRQVGYPPEETADIYAPSYQLRIDQFLYNMVRKGTAEQVEHALALGANPSATELYTTPSFPPLHYAAVQCDVEKVKVLLDAGADVFGRSGIGHEVVDVMWQAKPENLLGESWYKIHDMLREAGYNNLFDKPPATLKAADLHDRVYLSKAGNPTLFAYLVQNGKVDYVLGLLQEDAQPRLHAADLVERPDRGFGNAPLIDAIGRVGRLSDFFTAAVWQGRVEEMMSLREVVEKNPLWGKQVDFEKARAEVMSRRLKDLKDRAPKLKLGR